MSNERKADDVTAPTPGFDLDVPLGEEPDMLTEEDEEILDSVWDAIGSEEAVGPGDGEDDGEHEDEA